MNTSSTNTTTLHTKNASDTNSPTSNVSNNVPENPPTTLLLHTNTPHKNKVNSSFFSSINTNFIVPEFFPVTISPEKIQNTELNTVLIPTQETAQKPTEEAIKEITKKTAQKTTKETSTLQKKEHKNKKLKITLQKKTKPVSTQNIHTKIVVTNNNITKKTFQENTNTLKATTKMLAEVRSTQKASTQEVSIPSEQDLLHFDTDAIILNEAIFSRLTKDLENDKQQVAYANYLLANALETSSLTQTFQNEDGIFIPQTLKSSKRKSRNKNTLKEDLLGITITSDNFTHTSLRDIDFSDVNILAQNLSGKNTITDSHTESHDTFSNNIDPKKLLTDGVILAQTRVDNALSAIQNTDKEHISNTTSSSHEITPILDHFSVDRLLTVKTVYATTFEETQEELKSKKDMTTSFFELYDKTAISLEDTPMWDSIHDTFELRFHILKTKDTKTITENYGALDTQKLNTQKNINKHTDTTQSNVPNTRLTPTHLENKNKQALTLDELCLSSPEIIDLISYDAYFNDPISGTEDAELFEDFNINSDWIDLTGSLGTHYTFDVLYEKQGLLICIRNDTGTFIQCLPIAYKNWKSYEESHSFSTFLHNMQEKIHTFQNSSHSIVSTSLKKGQEWFTKNTNFEI